MSIRLHWEDDSSILLLCCFVTKLKQVRVNSIPFAWQFQASLMWPDRISAWTISRVFLVFHINLSCPPLVRADENKRRTCPITSPPALIWEEGVGGEGEWSRGKLGQAAKSQLRINPVRWCNQQDMGHDWVRLFHGSASLNKRRIRETTHIYIQ